MLCWGRFNFFFNKKQNQSNASVKKKLKKLKLRLLT